MWETIYFANTPGLFRQFLLSKALIELHAKAILGLPANVALKTPAASAVIYGQLDATGIAFEGVAEALRIPGADIRLFGKPASFERRRMGVALASADDMETARSSAKKAAALVKP